MKKVILNSYTVVGRTFTAQDIYDRSDKIGHNVVSGDTVIVDHISLTSIKNDLDETEHDLAKLATSDKINVYSNFAPVYMVKEFLTLVPYPKQSPYNYEDFAGYNHNAIMPELVSNIPKDEETIVKGCLEGPDNYLVTYNINLGELDYTDYINEGTVESNYILVELYENTQLYDSTELPFDLFYIYDGKNIKMSSYESFSIDMSTWQEYDSKNYKFEAYFINKDGNGTVTKMLKIPNSDYNFSLKLLIDHYIVQLVQSPRVWLNDQWKFKWVLDDMNNTEIINDQQYTTSTVNIVNNTNYPQGIEVDIDNLSHEYEQNQYVDGQKFKIWYKIVRANGDTDVYQDGYGPGVTLSSGGTDNVQFQITGTSLSCGDTIKFVLGYETLLGEDYEPPSFLP